MKQLFTFVLLSFSASISFSQTISLQTFATGFSRPVEIAHPANDSRLFVVEQAGKIKVVNSDGSVNPTLFLDLTSEVEFVNSPGSEQGLLGLTFHPDYANNGYFYVNYTRDGDGATIVARYSVSADPNVANTAETILLNIAQPYSNHNGGTIKFGPDGYLYIGMGDGGSGGDPGDRAQDITENLGKMLRIDVNSGSPYGIPPNNPFVGVAGNDEIWSTGMRNPWKFSFNRSNGDFWIADVGQYEIEEINKIPSPIPNSGLNFGWRCYEGDANFDLSSGNCPAYASTVAPFTQYTHSGTGGCSITGGYYYTGSLYPSFNNKYFFADYCTRKIGTVTDGGTVAWTSAFANSITTFGEDMNGELYVTGGTIVFKVVDETAEINQFSLNGLSVSPNPAKEEFKITNLQQLQLTKATLVDMSGKEVLTRNLESTPSNTISIANLINGFYMLTVEDVNGNSYQTKLLKQ
ncbi:MAG: PQQ-dependent sugar dehydrogenase [Bacteroidota bacterium]